MFMKILLSLILSLLMTLPNCGMVFAGSMDQMMNGGEFMEMSEMMGENMFHPQEESINNLIYNCCSDSAHNSTFARDTSPTHSSKDVIFVTRIRSFFIEEASVPHASERSDILYRPHAPPDPSGYSSLIGSSIKNLD